MRAFKFLVLFEGKLKMSFEAMCFQRLNTFMLNLYCIRFDLVKNLSLSEKHIQMKCPVSVSIKFRKVEYEQIIVHLNKT